LSVGSVNTSYLNELPGAGPPDTPSQELDEQDFLNLLMTQLQHQDPLSPMEGTQMMQQISSLNQVEQLQAANDNLQSLILGMASLNNASAVQLIDRSVMVAGDEFTAETSSVELGYVLGGEADSVTVSILDTAGEVVDTITASDAQAGLNSFTWNGAEAGESYQIMVEATFEDAEVTAQAAVSGTVTGLDFSEGIVQLVVGDLTLGLDQVLAVLPGSNAAQAEVLDALAGGDADPVFAGAPAEESE